MPLITVACHEDLTASDLVGRYLLESDETRWIDGPLTRAVKFGAICYLDEVVEARKDTTVLIHPLADYRRLLPVEKRGELLEAADGFLLVLSFNPGYQSALKDLKHSTRQRFVAIEFDYPEPDVGSRDHRPRIGLRPEVADGLAKLGEKVRNLREHGLEEGVSTRLLVYAGKLIARVSLRGEPARQPWCGRSPTRSRCSTPSTRSSRRSSPSEIAGRDRSGDDRSGDDTHPTPCPATRAADHEALWRHMAARLSDHSPKLAEAFMSAAPEVTSKIGAANLGAWADLGRRLGAGGWSNVGTGGRFLRRQPRPLRGGLHRPGRTAGHRGHPPVRPRPRPGRQLPA